MTEVISTRWVHAAKLDQYNKVECELDPGDTIHTLNLVTQDALSHLGTMLLKGLSVGQVNIEFGRKVTPLLLDAVTQRDINQAVEVAGGIYQFLHLLEKSIFTPAIEEREIPINEKTIELRVKACVEQLIVQAMNAASSASHQV